MKKIIPFVACLFICAAALDAEPPFSDLVFDKACKKAAEEKKVVMIDFYTVWCGPCKMLDNITWKDEKVAKWLNANAIALKIDAEKNRELAAKYKIRGYPTIVFLKPDGAVIDSLLGFRQADQFLVEAHAALTGKDSVARAKEQVGGDAHHDPMKRKQHAQALVQKGKFKEALEEYLWCFDYGAEQMGFGGVRLSFLLSDIATLGEKYPPAIKAMEKRRDAARQKLFPENPDQADAVRRSNAALEFAALNQYLHKDSQTLDAYDLLKKEGDSSRLVRKAMFHCLDELLLAKKRYGDFIESDKSALEVIDQAISQYTKSVSVSAIQPKDRRDETEKMMKKNVVEEGGKYYEAAIGLQKTKLGLRIARKLIKFDGSVTTYESLIKHAQHIDNRDAIQSVISLAEKNLNEEDLTDLKNIANKEQKAGGG